jgi:toxin ParE1/3/4
LSRRTIVWYPSAATDLDRLVEYLRERGSDVNAVRVLDRIDPAVVSLRSAPRRGRIVPEFAAHGLTTYREVVVHPWRVVYRVESHRIVVLTLVDRRRQLDELLLERLIRAE